MFHCNEIIQSLKNINNINIMLWDKLFSASLKLYMKRMSLSNEMPRMVADSIICGHFLQSWWHLPAQADWGTAKHYRMYARIAHKFCEAASSDQINSPQSHWPLAQLTPRAGPWVNAVLGTFCSLKEHSAWQHSEQLPQQWQLLPSHLHHLNNSDHQDSSPAPSLAVQPRL